MSLKVIKGGINAQPHSCVHDFAYRYVSEHENQPHDERLELISPADGALQDHQGRGWRRLG